MLDIVLVGFLDDDFAISHADEHFVADLHPGDSELILMEINMDIVILPVFSFRTTRAERLFSNHRGAHSGSRPSAYLSVFSAVELKVFIRVLPTTGAMDDRIGAELTTPTDHLTE